MYFSIHYENGSASFEHTINLPASDPDVVIDTMTQFIKTVFEPPKPEPEKDREDVRAELYSAVDEIIEDMYGYYDE